MKNIWFRKWHFLYVPVHPMGFIVSLLAIGFMVPVIFALFKSEQDFGKSLYEVFIYGTCTAFWWKWVVDRSSQ